MTAKTESFSKEYDAILEQSKKQPGVEELMRVYGQYSKLVEKSNSYLRITKPQVKFHSDSSTS